ncbi:hypothetical protein ACJX0J_007096, partial [Zea mays]
LFASILWYYFKALMIALHKEMSIHLLKTSKFKTLFDQIFKFSKKQHFRQQLI